jgi:uncharacterized protein with NRDE domain
MCVAAIAWSAHPDWLLVAIGNRDEYHARPAAPLARWDNGILAGQDLKSGGTWLGVSEAGRFALVTNRRGFGDADPGKASRGALVTDLLTGYADPASAPLNAFNPFNLFLAENTAATFLTNLPEQVRTTLPQGIYGLSNGSLDEPWPKTLKLKSALNDWLVTEGDVEVLFTALRSETLESIGLHTSTPSDIPLEAAETPIFIRNATYGTRCSTVITVGHNGQGRIMERRFDADANVTGNTALDFCWTV